MNLFSSYILIPVLDFVNILSDHDSAIESVFINIPRLYYEKYSLPQPAAEIFHLIFLLRLVLCHSVKYSDLS